MYDNLYHLSVLFCKKNPGNSFLQEILMLKLKKKYFACNLLRNRGNLRGVKNIVYCVLLVLLEVNPNKLLLK